MADAEATISRRRSVSRIWLVPLIAALLGAWMVFYTWRNEGPEITIRFSTAEGIEAGKTKIKARSVALGLVEEVALGKDLHSVVVTAKLERSAIALLHEDTQFWVVRARIGVGGISGLGTMLSGGYIELAPGTGRLGRRDFRGLDEPPVTPAGTPGLHLSLVGDPSFSINPGDPILYDSFTVGRIESAEFDVASREMRYAAFIESPYDELVSSRTRFWNTSGLSFSATADGIELTTGSLQSLLIGGIAFGLPSDMAPGSPAEDGASFRLYRDRKAIDERPYHFGTEYALQFDRSIRGLRPGAPVEFRGLRSGHVERIMLTEMREEIDSADNRGNVGPISVLIRLEPGRLEIPDSARGVERLKKNVAAAVQNGLRATLSTGSLLTGSLYVALDMFPDAEGAEVGSFAGYTTIPTVAGGLEGIEQRVVRLLDKLNALPLDDVTRSADATLRSADGMLGELEQTVAELRLLLASDDVQALPRSIETTLAELDRTLRSLNALAKTLDDQPNALIFSRDHVKDPEPPAGAP